MVKNYKSYDILKSPVITEKSTTLSANNQVVFKVATDATKPLIKAAIEDIFNVKVNAVNVINIKGKTKRFRGHVGKRSDYKKAVVTLAEGNAIDISAGVK